MQTNITARTVVIVLIILVCVYGIIGFPTSMAAIQKNFSNNIHLGLDLKGGTQLVLEVQVQDAVKADALQATERLKEDLQEAKHHLGFDGRQRCHVRGRRRIKSRSPSRASPPRSPAPSATSLPNVIPTTTSRR